MSLLRRLIIGVFMFGMGVGSSQAALIGVTDYGDYFSDAGTGLDWLDVTASVNRSYLDVSSQFGVGGDFEGWRYATAAEFGAMLSAATGGVYSGITGAGQTQILESATDLRDLIGLFGDTFSTGYQDIYGSSYCELHPEQCVDGDLVYTLGFLVDSPYVGYHFRGLIYDNDLISSNSDQVTTYGIYYDSFFAGTLGSYLVRNTLAVDAATTSVPEPSSVALMGLGLLGLGFARRKKAL